MNFKNFMVFLFLICISYGAPGPFSSTDTNGIESDVNQLPIQNETILKGNENKLHIQKDFDENHQRRHHRKAPESKNLITPEFIAQVVAASNLAYQESAKASKEKLVVESLEKVDDLEEIFACDDKSNDYCCTLISDFKLTKQITSCFDKHVGLTIHVLNQNKDLYFSQTSRMLVNEKEKDSKCIRYKKYSISSTKSIITLDEKINVVFNSDINWHIAFQLIKSYDLFSFQGFISGCYDLGTGTFQFFQTFWDVSATLFWFAFLRYLYLRIKLWQIFYVDFNSTKLAMEKLEEYKKQEAEKSDKLKKEEAEKLIKAETEKLKNETEKLREEMEKLNEDNENSKKKVVTT